MSQLITIDFQAMGTRCALNLYAEDETAARRSAELIMTDVARLEAKYSRYLADSFLSKINLIAEQGGSITVDAETATLLDYAQTCTIESDGLFDISSGLLRRAWNFQADGQAELPDPFLLNTLLERVGWQHLSWQSPCLTFRRAGMELDLGGIVKEYAADRAVTLLRELGIHHGLVNLGGDIAVTGPRADGQPWRVAIENPESPAEPLRIVELSNGAMASSGSYARCIDIDGVRYSHLLHPATGDPLTGTLAATVIAEQCVVAGSLATIALLKGDDGEAFLSSTQLPFLLLNANGRFIDHLTT